VWFSARYRRLPKLVEVWTTWDTAMKAKEQNDETACVTAARGEDGFCYILRSVHGRWETPDVGKFLVEQAQWFKRTYGAAYIGDLVEDKVSGTTLIQYVRRSNPDLVLIPVKAELDKVSRAHGVTPLCEAERVLLPDGTIFPATVDWCRDLVAKLMAFPVGEHDDVADAFVYALKRFLGTLGGRKSRRGRGGGYV